MRQGSENNVSDLMKKSQAAERSSQERYICLQLSLPLSYKVYCFIFGEQEGKELSLELLVFKPWSLEWPLENMVGQWSPISFFFPGEGMASLPFWKDLGSEKLHGPCREEKQIFKSTAQQAFAFPFCSHSIEILLYSLSFLGWGQWHHHLEH